MNRDDPQDIPSSDLPEKADHVAREPDETAGLTEELATAAPDGETAGGEESSRDPGPRASSPPAPDADGEDEDDDEEEAGPDRPMSVRDHLRELRKRLFLAFICAFLGFAICFPFTKELFDTLLSPLREALPAGSSVVFTQLTDPFFTHLMLAFVSGIFITSPLVFYQIWSFVAPGLYKEEKVWVIPIAFTSAVLFVAGGLFCYTVVFPFVFDFFLSYTALDLQAMPTVGDYLDFALKFIVAFGLVSELPLFVFFLARMGVVTAAMMRKSRRYAILGAVILGAILTPPDVVSQLLMAGPLILLYEVSIVVAAVFGKKAPEPAPDDEDDEDEDDEDEKEHGRAPGSVR